MNRFLVILAIVILAVLVVPPVALAELIPEVPFASTISDDKTDTRASKPGAVRYDAGCRQAEGRTAIAANSDLHQTMDLPVFERLADDPPCCIDASRAALRPEDLQPGTYAMKEEVSNGKYYRTFRATNPVPADVPVEVSTVIQPVVSRQVAIDAFAQKLDSMLALGWVVIMSNPGVGDESVALGGRGGSFVWLYFRQGTYFVQQSAIWATGGKDTSGVTGVANQARIVSERLAVETVKKASSPAETIPSAPAPAPTASLAPSPAPTATPTASPIPTAAPAPSSPLPSCTFTMGFKFLRDQIPDIIGNCLENEQFNAANGNVEQRTTGGLLVWRKSDNWTAFTNGGRTWINGPSGLEERANDERFPWEPDYLRIFVLTLNDLPSDFTDDGSYTGIVTNEDATIGLIGEPAKAARYPPQQGRVSGYESSYNSSSQATPAGPMTVDSAVSLFETSADAQRQFDEWTRTFPTTRRLPVREVWIPVEVEWSALPTPAIGNESSAFQSSLAFKAEHSNMEWVFQLVGFRKGKVLGFVFSVSTPNTADYSVTKRFAQVMESRVTQRMGDQ